MNSGDSRAQRRQAYLREWAAKSGRPEGDIYIPLSLLDDGEQASEPTGAPDATVLDLRPAVVGGDADHLAA